MRQSEFFTPYRVPAKRRTVEIEKLTRQMQYRPLTETIRAFQYLQSSSKVKDCRNQKAEANDVV